MHMLLQLPLTISSHSLSGKCVVILQVSVVCHLFKEVFPHNHIQSYLLSYFFCSYHILLNALQLRIILLKCLLIKWNFHENVIYMGEWIAYLYFSVLYAHSCDSTMCSKGYFNKQISYRQKKMLWISGSSLISWDDGLSCLGWWFASISYKVTMNVIKYIVCKSTL